MSSIPLFINLPIAPSLSKTLTALERDGYFTVHLVKFDLDILKLMIAARPCATVFSIIDEASYATTFEMLENLKRLHSANGEFARQPALRMILLAEHWGVTLERWMEVGIHEFIPAPIAKKALNFKLNRHYAKAVASAAVAAGETPLDPFAESEEEILVKGSDAESPPGRQTFYIPGGGGDLAAGKHERIVIFASTPLLGTGSEVWTPVPDSSGFEETWVTVIPGKGRGPNAPNEAVFFTGDKPAYDKEAGCWVFKGEAPKLVHRNADSTVIDPNLFACSTDRTRVLVKSTGTFSKFEIKHQSTENPANPPPRNFFISGAEPIKKPYEVSPVKDIADFLDQWKPKDRGDDTTENPAARIQGSGAGSPAPKTDAPEPRKSSPEAPLPGHYSGPGMRATESEFNSKVKPGAPKPGSLDGTNTIRRVRGADSLSALPPELEPEWPHEPVANDSQDTTHGKGKASPEIQAKSKQGDLSESPGRDMGKLFHEHGQEDSDQDSKKALTLTTGKAEAEPKAYGETPADVKKLKTRMSFPIFSADEQPKVLRARSTAMPEAKDAKAQVKRPQTEKERTTADYVAKDETVGGIRNLTTETGETDDRNLKIKDEKPGPDQEVRFKHDAPEGSLTWSMSSEDASNAPKAKKKKTLTDDGGRTLDPVKEPVRTGVEFEDLVADQKPAVPGQPTGTAVPAESKDTPPEPAPEKDESWLGTVRRVLARIFS